MNTCTPGQVLIYCLKKQKNKQAHMFSFWRWFWKKNNVPSLCRDKENTEKLWRKRQNTMGKLMMKRQGIQNRIIIRYSQIIN